MRKLNEAFLAYKIEQEFTKEQIMALFLNKMFFGQRAYGVAAAAQVYFNKDLADINVAEAATLAGVLPAPSRYNPVRSAANAERRRSYVLGRMYDLEFIDKASYEAAMAYPIESRLYGAAVELNAPYVAEMVRREMLSRYGEATYTAGYQVVTTLDSRLQTAANGIPNPPAEVAVGVPADLLRRRPDVRRAELQAAAQSALVGVAKADLYPHFTLIGSIGLQSSNSPLTREGDSSLSDLFSSNSFTYFAGPSLTWDLFNYGRIKNQVRVQDARLQQLVVNYQRTVLNAAREAEDAMAEFIEGQVQAEYLVDAVTASKRSVDISALQYGEGLTGYQRVLDAQRGLRIDQDALALVRGSVAISLVNMYKALGGGWEIRGDRDPVELLPEPMKAEMRERTGAWDGLLK